MQIPVAIEPIGDGQFRAHSFPPFTAVAEGRTREEAVSKVRAELSKEVESGKRVVMVDVNAKGENPWLAMAGWLKNDPLYEAWQAEIREYRRELDRDEGVALEEKVE